MQYETRVDKEIKIIYCTLTGELDIEESITISRDLREKSAELGFNVLYDARALQAPEASCLSTTLAQKFHQSLMSPPTV